MVELISFIVLLLSLAGMAVILWRKMPVLSKLPEPTGDLRKFLAEKIKEGTKKIPMVKDFSYELYLQKMLSRIRVLTMKTENKTGSWLERLRQKKNQKDRTNNDNYWDNLKKAKDDR